MKLITKPYVLSLILALTMIVSGVTMAQTNPVAAKDEALFLTSIPDMPLAPGLAEMEDQTLSFDKPEGRIVESLAMVERTSAAEIENFYAETLPALGWDKIGPYRYARKKEQFSYRFEDHDGQKFIRFILKPD